MKILQARSNNSLANHRCYSGIFQGRLRIFFCSGRSGLIWAKRGYTCIKIPLTATDKLEGDSLIFRSQPLRQQYLIHKIINAVMPVQWGDGWENDTVQGRKRNPNPNFLDWIFSSGVGVFHVNGWGPKSSICASKLGKSNFFGGISRDFAGISRRCPKSLRKTSLCSISVP